MSAAPYRRKPGPSDFVKWQQLQQGGLPAPAAIPGPPAPSPKAAPSKLVIEGDAQLWITLQKVTDPKTGWTKTTRAAQIPGGVLINTCSRKKSSEMAAEALVFVAGLKIRDGALIN